MFILALGLLFFLFGFCYVLRKYIQVKKYVKNFKVVTGVCTGNSPSIGLFAGKNGAKSQPYIVYVFNNQQYQILSRVTYEGVAAFMIKGKKFKVLYNPNNPKDAILKNELTMYILICSVFILFLLILFFLYSHDFL